MGPRHLRSASVFNIGRLRYWLVWWLVAMLLVACPRPVPLSPAIRVEHPVACWLRPASAVQGIAVYMTLTNRGGQADRLVGARSDLVERVPVVRLVRAPTPHLARVEGGVPLPPGADVRLHPEGPFLFLPIAEPPALGTRVALYLEFERSQGQIITVTLDRCP